jgi:glycosyltransferase involved in cell wall biosynthesis
MKIDLVWLGDSPAPAWQLGAVHALGTPTPTALHELVARAIPVTSARAWLFWDGRILEPDPAAVRRVLEQSSDVWHAGLRLGMLGAPRMIDFVQPTWMLNRDPDPDRSATSWRLSLNACLVRTEVLSQLGGPRPEFTSLDAAALELGHRYLQRGAFVRHEPALLAHIDAPELMPRLGIEDEIRFVAYRFGRRWMQWAAMRALLTGYAPALELVRAARAVLSNPIPSQPAPFRRDFVKPRPTVHGARVTVVIPTLERYSSLRKLLAQLGDQTVSPLEVLVVDQTPRDLREPIAGEFPGLPLEVITLDQPGQCTSRNEAIRIASGDFLLFLDDDVEVSPTLVEDHLSAIQSTGADVCSGVAIEPHGQGLPADFAYTRLSNVFPTCNTLIRKTALADPGLFDLAYDRAARADGDLGTRVYLSGALMVLCPSISVIHHHAPRGGLRAHRARVDTYAASRDSILKQHLPSVSELYFGMRYSSADQVREMEWLRVLGTFSVRGSRWRKLLKALVSTVRLPYTTYHIRRLHESARRMLESYPQIPRLEQHADRCEPVAAASSPSRVGDALAGGTQRV